MRNGEGIAIQVLVRIVGDMFHELRDRPVRILGLRSI